MRAILAVPQFCYYLKEHDSGIFDFFVHETVGQDVDVADLRGQGSKLNARIFFFQAFYSVSVDAECA